MENVEEIEGKWKKEVGKWGKKGKSEEGKWKMAGEKRLKKAVASHF